MEALDADTLGKLRAVIDGQPYPLLFVTVSGAHLYGFPSPDSDWDLRGVHVLPAREMLGFDTGPETLEAHGQRDGLDLDLVTHDAGKFFRLLLRRNGYVLEQVTSPLVLHTTPAHAELKALVPDCLTRHHAHHYLGFARTQWRLFQKDQPRRVKPLLYVYRVLLTGIHLMRTGEIEANLPRLNETFHLPYVDELIARKLAGPEHSVIDIVDEAFHAAEYERLYRALADARDVSTLPDLPSARAALNDLLIRLRGHSPIDDHNGSCDTLIDVSMYRRGDLMARVMSATDARIHFGEVIRGVAERDETIIVERGGRPSVVVLSVAEYERLRAAHPEPSDWLAEVDRVRAMIREELNGRVLPSASEIIHQMREERDAEILGGLR